ncbi:MAG: DUF885 domain-containing protein [Acidobacteria bacterium]|nr:DUF885 domain-containing protein [Acidobacteriota bacterium]
MPARRRLACATALVALATVSCSPPAPPPSASARLSSLAEREWQWRLRESPTLASSVGDHRFDDRLPAETLDDQARRAKDTEAFLGELDGIAPASLDDAGRVNREILRAQLVDRLDAFRFREHLLPLNADSSFHTSFAFLPMSLRFASTADYENYLARLRAFAAYMDQNIGLMREGIRTGITQPRAALQGIETSVDPLLVADATTSPLFTPFAAFPPAVPPSERERLRAAAVNAIDESVTPAYRRFRMFLVDEYVPKARATLGARDLPDGAAYYDMLVKRFTTLDLTADQVHATGLREVAALRAEMEQVMRSTGFTGTFDAFLTFLRTDRRFYASSPDQLLKEASFIAKRMDAKLPKLFTRLPRQPYGVAPVPEFLAPKYTGGRYNPNPRAGTEPGYYWVNTYALETRPLYNLEALTLHEAVPGHHLQGALTEELESLPNFRRYSYISAFGEGWGLYAEWLGKEVGFYQDPYSDFGRLTYAMWRAARLVVDTGLHAKGWTRQQAIDYLASQTALSIHECTTETDRYIAWPGQALSYKMGELKIRELRARAEQALGPRFDVRRFHDELLAHGPVPLPVLERIIDAFIAKERAT